MIPILRLQVINDYVHWHCSIDFFVKSSLIDETLSENYFYFTLIMKWFLLNSFGEMCFLEEELQKDAKKSKFDNFESALYMKSGSMPLMYSSMLRQRGKDTSVVLNIDSFFLNLPTFFYCETAPEFNE